MTDSRSDMPRISIRPTPANDLHLIMNLLAPSGEIARLIAHPLEFFRAHRGEWRYLEQTARGHARHLRQRASEPADDGGDAAPAVIELVTHRRTSLLR
ncbi:MAG: hypothetical protein ACJ8AD_01350 [Gemmatimonadaceae bacterium]